MAETAECNAFLQARQISEIMVPLRSAELAGAPWRLERTDWRMAQDGPRWLKIGFLQFYFRDLQGRSLVNSSTIQEMHLRGRGQRKAKTHLFDDLMFLSADGRAIFDSNGITLRK